MTIDFQMKMIHRSFKLKLIKDNDESSEDSSSSGESGEESEYTESTESIYLGNVSEGETEEHEDDLSGNESESEVLQHSRITGQEREQHLTQTKMK